jgi:hypothetical protein
MALQDMLEMGVAGFGAIPYSAIVPNNTTGVVVKATAGMLFAVKAFNNGTAIAYIRFYNQTTAPATTDTPVLRMMIPGPASGGGGFIAEMPTGRAFSVGIAYRVTTGIADNDATAPAASTYLLNIGYK